ncbi:PIG-L deacetylase family protein [Planococcus sp. X10-3]|uniref:PIG-L deacetylase family protein n=1 Tax=Planococcus sp. X10-3 TaxID=3061240 RepID=UPI003BAE1959
MKQTIMKAASPLLAQPIVSSLKRFYRSNREITPLGDARRVLVFAPHIDDETIGVGGTIRKHVSNGAEVHIAVITDGKNSNSSSSQQQNLANIRKDELYAIQDSLGFSSITYLELPDGEVKNADSSAPLQQVIEQLKPDMIYTPSLIDAHPDHVYSAHLLADALEESAASGVTVREYEINCPVPPEEINCVIDITAEFPVKKRATEAFKSQVIAFDGFLALSSIKASLIKDPSIKYVETFIESKSSEFIRAAKNLRMQDRNYQLHFKQANRTVTLRWAIFKNIKMKRAFYQSR